MERLFDDATGGLLLDEAVLRSPIYQAMIEDNVITDDEIMAQATRVLDLLKQIDRQLGEDDRALVIQAISQIAVLYEVNAMKGGKEHGDL